MHTSQVPPNAGQLRHMFRANETCGMNEDGRTSSEESLAESSKSAESFAPSAPQGSGPDDPPPEKIVRLPEEWAMPWSNALLRQRIEEREKEPGCGGGLARRKSHKCSDVVDAYHACPDLSDVDATDPAARFIAANALKDLAHFTFEREAQFLESSSEFGSTAFYVTDSDRHRQTTLDTRNCSGRHTSAPERSEVLRTLFRQVPILAIFNLGFFKTS